MTRQLLVTSALPYANGPIHIGHLVEYIQTDIFVRFQKLRGNRALYVCADDTHGTAIMIRATKQGIAPEDLIASMSHEHQRDFAGFDIVFDHYGSTNDSVNRNLCHQIWQSLRDADLIVEKDVDQLFDESAATFLADRFVRGTCPQCGLTDQAGDNCNNGHTYAATDLVDPVSTLSGATPVMRTAKHLFVRLEKLRDDLEQYVACEGVLQPEVANYIRGHFLAEDLKDWDVSRPEPYFGFEIPDSPGNYWYVWFDAPIGYIASTQNWCDANGSELDQWWRNPDCEIHHFIGKDINYFHTLFWPGMLKTAGFELPTQIHIHGFLTVDGVKMSKRDGTLVAAETFLKYGNPEHLRYFYASKLTPRIEDIDLSIEEYVEKVNSDLVNKFVNLASRVGRFANRTGLANEYPDDGGLFADAAAAGESIAAAYEAGDTARAMRLILELCDAANPYVEHARPWEMAKDPDRADELQRCVTVAMNLFRQLAIYLSPVLPRIARLCGDLMDDPITSWEQSQTPLVDRPVGQFKRMMDRATVEEFQKMVDESRPDEEVDLTSTQAIDVGSAFQDDDGPIKAEPLAEEITIEDFTKVDLRVARVIAAEQVPEANKLLKLTVSLGGENHRQIFAGIKAAYEPDQLVGRLVVIAANLKPRKMRFGISEGMVTAAGPGGADVFLIGVDEGAKPGQRMG